MELTINKDRILKAAEKCETVKGVLKELFPEVFEDDVYFDLSVGITLAQDLSKMCFGETYQFEVRKSGMYADKGFYLSSYGSRTLIDWKIEIDEQGYQVLVPRKR